MKLCIVASELPYPPRHGGQVDVWRRICALAGCGVKVQLVAWHSTTEIDAGHRAQIEGEVDSLVLLKRRTGWRGNSIRLLLTLFQPFLVSARVIFRRGGVLAAVRSFGPDVVWVDALYGWNLGRYLGSKLKLPVVLRSQNVEHEYVSMLGSKARSTREKLFFFLSKVHLRRYEFSAVSDCARYYDISLDDLAYWRQEGYLHGEWLPPFCSALVAPPDRSVEFDVGFMGNLYTPNNVDGLRWFIKDVLPKMPTRRRVLIAGSNPSPALRAAVADEPDVAIWENPESILEVYARTAVLINPVLGGSGVNLKAIEMLQTDKPIVSTPRGVGGLPQEVKSLFRVESAPDKFAEAIEACLARPGVDIERRRVIADRYFGDDAARRLIDSLRRLCGKQA